MQFIEKSQLVQHFTELSKESIHDDFESGYVTAMQNAADYIDDIPAEDVDIVLHGEWKGIQKIVLVGKVYDRDNTGSREQLSIITGQCSICGKEASRSGGVHSEYLYDRCPHCGAIMTENYERKFWTDDSKSQKPDYNYNPPETNQIFNYD